MSYGNEALGCIKPATTFRLAERPLAFKEGFCSTVIAKYNSEPLGGGEAKSREEYPNFRNTYS
jgi:hypothetical protein